MKDFKEILSLKKEDINNMGFNEIQRITKEISFIYKNSSELLTLEEQAKLENIITMLNHRSQELLQKTRVGRLLLRKGLRKVEKLKKKGVNPDKIIEKVK